MTDVYIRVPAPTPDSSEFIRSLYGKYASDSEAVVCDGFIFVPQRVVGHFAVTAVSRDDFRAVGYDASEVDDITMNRIAEKIGEAACESGVFWDMLRFFGEDLELPEIPEEERSW